MSIWLGSGFSYLVKHSLVVVVKVFEDVINIYSWLQVKWITLHGVFDPHPVRHEEQDWAFHRGPIQSQDCNLKTGQSVRSRIMTTKSTISWISNLLLMNPNLGFISLLLEPTVEIPFPYIFSFWKLLCFLDPWAPPSLPKPVVCHLVTSGSDSDVFRVNTAPPQITQCCSPPQNYMDVVNLSLPNSLVLFLWWTLIHTPPKRKAAESERALKGRAGNDKHKMFKFPLFW